jgi:predicted nucleotidyltransferase
MPRIGDRRSIAAANCLQPVKRISGESMPARIHVDRRQLGDFCDKWRITEFALFGSVLRNDFSRASDVDVLLTFQEGAPWSLTDVVRMQSELEQLFGRHVDIVEKKAIANPFRRHRILSSNEVIYAAG